MAAWPSGPTPPSPSAAPRSLLSLTWGPALCAHTPLTPWVCLSPFPQPGSSRLRVPTSLSGPDTCLYERVGSEVLLLLGTSSRKTSSLL